MDGQGEGGLRIWVRDGGAGLRVLGTRGQLGLELGVDANARANGKRPRRSRGLGPGAVSGTLTVGARRRGCAHF